ncbi:TIGR04282 family arsenosugar biosynthesis glycosyltransferase [Curtobacterium sp. RRHDQ10]|uniref:TIGR04282 family arsenosugar biosynthesis glycosyltransferase n=1 Tax=Curtobacterium phyllosphaerae TaxID=3413379 RepID=UPI003BF18667
MTAVALIAKECVPGRVKTRLAPAIGHEHAAAVAAASLADTIDAVLRMPADRRILLFDGSTPPAGTESFEVMPQVTGGLDERIAAMFDAVDEPTLLVGMDTPQLAPSHTAAVFAEARHAEQHDAWFGPASDGGFWGLWLREPDGDLVRGVPMSRDDTGALQLGRLRGAGLRVGVLDELLDVDTIEDARAVGALVPGSRFDAALTAAVATAPQQKVTR